MHCSIQLLSGEVIQMEFCQGYRISNLKNAVLGHLELEEECRERVAIYWESDGEFIEVDDKDWVEENDIYRVLIKDPPTLVMKYIPDRGIVLYEGDVQVWRCFYSSPGNVITGGTTPRKFSLACELEQYGMNYVREIVIHMTHCLDFFYDYRNTDDEYRDWEECLEEFTRYFFKSQVKNFVR